MMNPIPYTLYILSFLDEEPSFGYALSQRIQAEVNPAFIPNAMSQLLTKMVEMGWIRMDPRGILGDRGQKRKTFYITHEGREILRKVREL